MEKRAVVVIVAACVLGLATAALGFTSEYFKHKAFVRSDTFGCEYRRTPAFALGILAAPLSLAGVALVTAASACFGRIGAGAGAVSAAESSRRCVRTVLAILAWVLVAGAAVMFLYGAAWNRGWRGGFTAVGRWPWSNNSDGGRSFDFVCPDLRNGLFVSASIEACFGIACAIAAYADMIRWRERTATLGVAMAQQPYPPAAPVAYPPAQPPYGGYGAKYPAGTA